METKKHLYYLDNLRVALIILVIAHHVGQAYGPTGGWWPIQETAHAAILGPFFTVNRSFFMSLFFMISGYFAVMSCNAKGPHAFIKERFIRLGIPALVFGLVMIPLQLFVFSGPAWPIEVGHLWFLEHLLIFSACYALLQAIQKPLNANEQKQADPPGYVTILVFAFLLAVASAVIRIWFPIDKWVYMLGFIRVAFADVPRDLSFFVIGMLAYRRQWFGRFPTNAGYIWLCVGLILAGAWYAYAMLFRNIFLINDIAMGVIYPIWESLLCCGMCIGLTVWFREKFDFQGKLGNTLAKSIFHVPVVILFQFLVLGLALPPFIKFTVVTLLSVPATFWFSNWVRKPMGL
jgi:fucose 4-O-acetylase-like acetyltransferase